MPKRELSYNAKLSIYRSAFVPTLTYGHAGWVLTERTRLWIEAADVGFLGRVACVSLRDKVRSSVICERLRESETPSIANKNNNKNFPSVRNLSIRYTCRVLW